MSCTTSSSSSASSSIWGACGDATPFGAHVLLSSIIRYVNGNRKIQSVNTGPFMKTCEALASRIERPITCDVVEKATDRLKTIWKDYKLEALAGVGYLTGSTLEHAISQELGIESRDPSDIDIILCAPMEKRGDVLALVEKWVKSRISEYGMINLAVSKFALSVGHPKVQFIPCFDKTPKQVTGAFDIDCVASWFDGKKIFAWKRAVAAWVERINDFRPAVISPFYESRIRKYFVDKGYDFAIDMIHFGGFQRGIAIDFSLGAFGGGLLSIFSGEVPIDTPPEFQYAPTSDNEKDFIKRALNGLPILSMAAFIHSEEIGAFLRGVYPKCNVDNTLRIDCPMSIALEDVKGDPALSDSILNVRDSRVKLLACAYAKIQKNAISFYDLAGKANVFDYKDINLSKRQRENWLCRDLKGEKRLSIPLTFSHSPLSTAAPHVLLVIVDDIDDKLLDKY
jgi:hypothetical protein